ncbi:lipoprotein releasing system ATP-binding protein LolD [Acetobacter nitrogenifigens DSM 23921 = NBRC 105050]|uniref:Lipoprotein-releasing system ATP-binding protein LolD n=1 Tax=Acetobacter nitrogenifigens DSM 23921 = NBRC 105050 TaxID=1120919 RepID=A0A511XBI0_9PROT|nr:ABC transporter ATP-binding protein [Acetobacter nitrogenifigens]GBQ90619.1 lipoprotein releasing system ATP-binding protein LolD [Acetobacter nitrogenifigens DSM 23921 = NBRC 105050]GEN60300.1 lipoprotein-releasing system ATP-binding protein LolD [Acetobacter nitrogenifigens DSM 23921 = NBRC 105050]
MAKSPGDVVLRLQGVQRSYVSGDGERLSVLRGVDFTLHAGEIVALVAPSGTGKSTLLHVAGLLDSPDGGSVEIGGRDATRLSDGERTVIRSHEVGFVYQFHHLLGEFTARENVMLPQMIAWRARGAARLRADALLGSFGLAHRLDHLPGKLSGGEQQRVAIARSLANEPSLLLADEPTGNLDVRTADVVFEELLGAVRRSGLGALIATHNDALAARMDRVVTLRDGALVAL